VKVSVFANARAILFSTRYAITLVPIIFNVPSFSSSQTLMSSDDIPLHPFRSPQLFLVLLSSLYRYQADLKTVFTKPFNLTESNSAFRAFSDLSSSSRLCHFLVKIPVLSPQFKKTTSVFSSLGSFLCSTKC